MPCDPAQSGYVFENDSEPVPLPLEAACRLYADADAEDLAETPTKARTRFGGLNASQGSVLPEIDYWDAERLLPRIPGEGCVGYMIGDTGSHKTGTDMGLDCPKPNSRAFAMGSLRRSDTRLDNEMSERTSERCRNGMSLGHCMSERGRRPGSGCSGHASCR